VKLDGFRAPNQFLVQSSAGSGLQNGFWRNPRRVLGSKSVFGPIPGGFRGVRVGAYWIRPIRRPPRGRMNVSGARPCRDVWRANAEFAPTSIRQNSPAALRRPWPTPSLHGTWLAARCWCRRTPRRGIRT